LLVLVLVVARPAEATFPGKIAYSGFDGKDFEIYTINPGGGSRFNATNNNTDDCYPSWGIGSVFSLCPTEECRSFRTEALSLSRSALEKPHHER
jgi:hypothetical protein